MTTARKASVTLGGEPLAGTGPVTWRFTPGVTPYSATLTVSKGTWERLEPRMGQPLVLSISDSRGKTVDVQDVYILHKAAGDSPHRVSFLVADKRWLWPYKLIARDFNIPRKTGNRTAYLPNVPIENLVLVDKYDFLPATVKPDGTRWSAREAVEEVLDLLTDGEFDVRSFPFGGGDAGQFSLQNVTLRDPGDAALARMLGYVPGADVFVTAEGRVEVYDATDRNALRSYFDGLPISTRAGDFAVWVDRVKIRPSQVRVYYQREMEVVFNYADNYVGSTFPAPDRDAPYIENVIPTVDPSTEVTDYDPESGRSVTKTVPPGTWVAAHNWLAAMDLLRPEDSLPWTFETIRAYWLAGDLDGVLGGRGQDDDPLGNVAMRIQALKQHFRQTFRINSRYMQRIRDIRAVRVALLDPVTGARAPAAVWGQACIVPSTKGKLMAARGITGPESTRVYRNVDYLARSETGGQPLVNTAPGPTAVNIGDRDVGVFRLEWIVSPYGGIESFIPSQVVDSQGRLRTPTRDMGLQDDEPVFVGARVEAGVNGLFLSPRLQYKVLLTIVPAAPNDLRQLHRVDVEPSDVAGMFAGALNIENGEGPPLGVFVPPGEETARFALRDVDEADATLRTLLGLAGGGEGDDSPTELAGYVLANDGVQGFRHLEAHARALAAEVLVAFNDTAHGSVATVIPEGGLGLHGNMSGAAIRVGQSPSAKVDAVHSFPGQARAMSRFALLPEATRVQVLGVLPFPE